MDPILPIGGNTGSFWRKALLVLRLAAMLSLYWEPAFPRVLGNKVSPWMRCVTSTFFGPPLARQPEPAGRVAVERHCLATGLDRAIALVECLGCEAHEAIRGETGCTRSSCRTRAWIANRIRIANQWVASLR